MGSGGVRVPSVSILTHTISQITVFAMCLWYLKFPALAERQYQQQKWEHPISGDTYKQNSCVIAILIIVASIQRSKTPPHLLCFLTWHLPDNVSHLFIHLSANTPGHCCILPPLSLWWFPVSLLLFLMQCFHSAEQQTVCSQKAQKHDMFCYTTSYASCLSSAHEVQNQGPPLAVESCNFGILIYACHLKRKNNYYIVYIVLYRI